MDIGHAPSAASLHKRAQTCNPRAAAAVATPVSAFSISNERFRQRPPRRTVTSYHGHRLQTTEEVKDWRSRGRWYRWIRKRTGNDNTSLMKSCGKTLTNLLMLLVSHFLSVPASSRCVQLRSTTQCPLRWPAGSFTAISTKRCHWRSRRPPNISAACSKSSSPGYPSVPGKRRRSAAAAQPWKKR